MVRICIMLDVNDYTLTYLFEVRHFNLVTNFIGILDRLVTHTEPRPKEDRLTSGL